MTVRSYSRGWPVVWLGTLKRWVYEDTNGPIEEERPCVRCGRLPTKEGYDACIGYIKGIASARCGHGVEKPYFVKDKK